MRLILASTGTVLTANAWAVDAPQPTAAVTDQVTLLAASCSGCHSTRVESSIPALDGRRARLLEKYLLGYKRGKRKGTLMPRLARGYTDEQLGQLARYFSARKRNAR